MRPNDLSVPCKYLLTYLLVEKNRKNPSLIDCNRNSVQDGTQKSMLIIPNIIHTKEKDDNITLTSELESVTSSKRKKNGETLLLCDWVRKSLFKYCKFITSDDSLEYDQPICLFTLEENNVTEGKQKWWNLHKKIIVKTLNEKRGCVVESLKASFKSEW